MSYSGKKAVLLVAACLLVSCTEKGEAIRMAAPDGLCEVLARCLIQGGPSARAVPSEEVFPLMDCCSTTAEWALSADRVDVAWLCPDAVKALLAKDDRFLLLGPALVNSEVLVVREGAKVNRIAYGTKREYQRAIIRERFGQACVALPVVPSALPYLYEEKAVDGVVIDVVKGISLKGRHLRLSADNRDVVTYMLVASKSFRRTKAFPQFIARLESEAAQLNKRDVLAEVLGKYKKGTLSHADCVASLAVRFLPP